MKLQFSLFFCNIITWVIAHKKMGVLYGNIWHNIAKSQFKFFNIMLLVHAWTMESPVDVNTNLGLAFSAMQQVGTQQI